MLSLGQSAPSPPRTIRVNPVRVQPLRAPGLPREEVWACPPGLTGQRGDSCEAVRENPNDMDGLRGNAYGDLKVTSRQGLACLGQGWGVEGVGQRWSLCWGPRSPGPSGSDQKLGQGQQGTYEQQACSCRLPRGCVS